MPTVYKPETYEVVSRWTEDTLVKYGPNIKRFPSKSYDRYAAYAKAKTVGEALAFGTKPEDLLFDFENGHLTVVGGPVREAAIDPTSSDLKTLTRTDRVVSKWAGWGSRAADETRKLLRQNPDGSFRVVIVDYMSEKRKSANDMAKEMVETAEKQGRKITEAEVLKVLRQWRFAKNDTRQNVLPEGQEYVFSDTLGLIRARDGRYMEKEATREFPEVTKLLGRWMRDHSPDEFGAPFPFTSINVNFKYAARRHRDGNNVGPSMIKALGKFTGGELGYFPNDDQKTSLEQLPLEDRVSLNLKDGFALFNGNCAHEVNAFEGERYSLVFFTVGKFWKTPPDVKKLLTDAGIQWPTEESLTRIGALLHPPRGYGSERKATDDKPGVLHFPADRRKLKKPMLCQRKRSQSNLRRRRLPTPYATKSLRPLRRSEKRSEPLLSKRRRLQQFPAVATPWRRLP